MSSLFSMQLLGDGWMEVGWSVGRRFRSVLSSFFVYSSFLFITGFLYFRGRQAGRQAEFFLLLKGVRLLAVVLMNRTDWSIY